MLLTSKGKKIMSNMKSQYGAKKGKQVFYASRNKGTIDNVDPESKTAFDQGFEDFCKQAGVDILELIKWAQLSNGKTTRTGPSMGGANFTASNALRTIDPAPRAGSSEWWAKATQQVQPRQTKPIQTKQEQPLLPTQPNVAPQPVKLVPSGTNQAPAQGQTQTIPMPMKQSEAFMRGFNDFNKRAQLYNKLMNTAKGVGNTIMNKGTAAIKNVGNSLRGTGNDIASMFKSPSAGFSAINYASQPAREGGLTPGSEKGQPLDPELAASIHSVYGKFTNNR